MAASDEIRKTKRNKKSTTSGPVQQTSSSGSKPAGFVSSLVKILVYSSILIGLSSQFEATRPIYKEYAHPYVATYVQVSFRVISTTFVTEIVLRESLKIVPQCVEIQNFSK